MTNISLSAGRVIMRDGKIATEQECCCCPCYVQSVVYQLSLCPLPEFAFQCNQLQQDFNNIVADLEAAGYTVNLRALDAAEIPCEDPKCGWEITFSCDSCAPEWFEPFFPNGNPNPEDWCVIQSSGFLTVANISGIGVSLQCSSVENPNYLGSLISFEGNDANGNPVNYIPCCGNPLP